MNKGLKKFGPGLIDDEWQPPGWSPEHWREMYETWNEASSNNEFFTWCQWHHPHH